MSEKINRIFRKFLIVAVCLVVAGSSSGYSTDTDTETRPGSTDNVVDFEHNLDDYVPAKKRT